MLIYYFMFLFPAMMAALQPPAATRPHPLIWGLTGFVLTLLLGFRMSGGDWYNYFGRFQDLAYLPIEQVLLNGDPGYQLISYFMYQWGFGFFAVTFICAVISVTGLMVFLKRLSNPWLGLAVAIPYLYIVVYMGYMRQGVALGLVLWGMAYLDRGKFLWFVALVALAVTFHKTAILMMAFGVFQQGKGKIVRLLAIILAGVGILFAFVGESAYDRLYADYVQTGMQSEGAYLRIALNALPALLLFSFRKAWKAHFHDYGFWSMVAAASLSAIPLVGPASTAVDRMALYFLPLQIVVFSRLPFLMRHILPVKVTTLFVLLFYLVVLSVWLNLGNFSMWWIPYENAIMVYLFG